MSLFRILAWPLSSIKQRVFSKIVRGMFPERSLCQLRSITFGVNYSIRLILIEYRLAQQSRTRNTINVDRLINFTKTIECHDFGKALFSEADREGTQPPKESKRAGW